MFGKTITFEGAGEANHKPCDVVNINGERWAVESINQMPNSYRLNLIPLQVFIASHKRIGVEIAGCEGNMTLQEYLNVLCEEYVDNCCC